MNVLCDLNLGKNRHFALLVKFFFLGMFAFLKTNPLYLHPRTTDEGGMGEWLKPVVC